MNFRDTKTTIETLIRRGAFFPVVLLLMTGCGSSLPGDAGTGGNHNGTGYVDTWQDPADAAGGEGSVALTIVDNNSAGDGSPFDQYKTVTLTHNHTCLIDGDIHAADVVEIFEIGSVGTGDRLVITANAVDSLDPVVAVFDANGDAMIVNDDRNYYGGDYNSAIDMQSHRDTNHCYVAVAASTGSGTIGPYSLSIRWVSGATLPESQPQLVYLNFDGAEAVVIGRRDPVYIPPFEGSLIGEEFAGQTKELIELIVARIRHDYTGLNVEFVSSRENPNPASPYTTLHFGAYDPGLLGLADYVDEYNEVVTQKAIIFVDTFQAFLPLNPSLEEMAHALANVASHEAGHLLGLNHTDDPHEIMDITANLRQMLAIQVFRRAPFHPDIFPIGYQDGGKLLFEAVGGDLALFKSTAAEQLTMRAAWYDQGEPTPARLRVNQPFCTCNCPICAKQRHRHATQQNGKEAE
ncbi:MAG: matrixin family metalloprotease [Phycisphaerae bacterium]|nr:matrixin family metalloprotease [Phycisphaerae bacterium]